MKLTIDQALDRYARQCGVASQPKVLRFLRGYLAWGGQPTDANLRAYLQTLVDAGQRPATVDLARRRIRAFWRALGYPPPRATLDFHPGQDSERPALSRDILNTLAGAAASGTLSPYPRALFTLALLYGPRAIELARVQDRDVDGAAGRWYCRAAKGSRARWLWIPPAYREALEIPWPTVTVAHVEAQFGRIWAVADLGEKPPHVGWHAARRALVRDLAVAGVPDGAIARFMGWASGGPAGHAMVALYKAPTQEVGVDGAMHATPVAEGTRAADAAVWDRHPALSGSVRAGS